MSGVPTGKSSRRTVAKSAAWSVPVVAAGVAAPTAAASTAPKQDVAIAASCRGLNIFGVGASLPQFTITAVNAPIEAGSTFLLTSAGLANVTIGKSGNPFDIQLLGKDTARITLKKRIPVGGQKTVKIHGILSVIKLERFTLAVENVIGNKNSVPSNDAASEFLTGVKVGPVLVGICGASRADEMIAQNEAAMRQLSPAQQAQVAQALNN